MRSKVVRIPYEEENGSISHVLYRRLSARLPEFLKAFPPDKYRLETVTTDLLSLQTGLLDFLKAALAAGVRPADLGISMDALSKTFVSRSTLFGPNDTPIRTASARGVVSEYKDHEKLETAAYQRILASLGHGGELFDGDEDRDLAAQAGTTAETAQSGPSSDLATLNALPMDLTDGTDDRDAQDRASPAVTAGNSSIQLRESQRDDPPQNVNGAPASVVHVQPEVEAAAFRSGERPASRAISRQIATWARRIGVEPNTFTSQTEAIAELQRLATLESQKGRSETR